MVNRTTKEIVMTKKFLIAAAFVGALVSGPSAFAGEQCTKPNMSGPSNIVMTCTYDDGSLRVTNLDTLGKLMVTTYYPNIGSPASATIRVNLYGGACTIDTYRPPQHISGQYDPKSDTCRPTE